MVVVPVERVPALEPFRIFIILFITISAQVEIVLEHPLFLLVQTVDVSVINL